MPKKKVQKSSGSSLGPTHSLQESGLARITACGGREGGAAEADAKPFVGGKEKNMAEPCS